VRRRKPAKMRKAAHEHAFAPVTGLAWGAAGATSIALRCPRAVIQASALAEDLFRLRIASGGEFSAVPSWAAVAETAWDIPVARVKKSPRRAVLQTGRGQLTVRLTDGGWELRDNFGRLVFEAPPGATGFGGPEARTALRLEEEESVFGLGESTGTFNKRGLIREFWNIDVGGHARTVHPALRNMYISVPFAISRRNGRAAGLFWDNPARQVWDIGQTQLDRWQMKAVSGEIDLYLFLGPACAEILERYTELTGRMPLPPQWALGYQQCRYSYKTRRRAEEIAGAFRQKRIPCDVLYLDIHHMDGYRVFTFGKTFRRPRQMIAQLARQGFKVVTIVDPGVKDDSMFPVLQRGQQRGAFIKAPDGHSDYRGEVWPGSVRFPDFLNPEARRWWGEEQARFQRLGIAGFWNDMNEPSDFSAPDKDFPSDCVHQTPLGPQRHGPVHNVYGSQMARASYEGALACQPDRRPFVITRAGYAGLQRHAAVWTGDNDACWEHLADSVQMLLNLGVSGVPFCGADVGGFHGNTTGELLARWTELAAFTPFFRNHSNLGTIDQEPWAFGARIEAICRRYIELRYQFLPYFYSLFVEAHPRGAPIMRPLYWHYPNDAAAAASGDQFLLGADLLVAPILRQGATARSVYLPAGIWFDFWTGEGLRGGRHVLADAPLDRLPLFVRAGAILPAIPVQQFVGERAMREANLHIWPSNSGRLPWYEDDGVSLGWLRGECSERVISFVTHKHTTHCQFASVQGAFPTAVRRWRIQLRNVSRPVHPRIDGRAIPVTFHQEWRLCSFEFANRAEAFEVRWR
jgi:alpha-glucosidase